RKSKYHSADVGKMKYIVFPQRGKIKIDLLLIAFFTILRKFEIFPVIVNLRPFVHVPIEHISGPTQLSECARSVPRMIVGLPCIKNRFPWKQHASETENRTDDIPHNENTILYEKFLLNEFFDQFKHTTLLATP